MKFITIEHQDGITTIPLEFFIRLVYRKLENGEDIYGFSHLQVIASTKVNIGGVGFDQWDKNAQYDSVFIPLTEDQYNKLLKLLNNINKSLNKSISR